MIERVPFDQIRALRDEHRREMNCQIVHDSWHERGFTDSYLISRDGEIAGYGAVGGAPGDARDQAVEFFLRPPFRDGAVPAFRELLAASDARCIVAQTNDALLSQMLHAFTTERTSDVVLFADGEATALPSAGAVFRPVTEADRARMFPHAAEPVGDWGLECGGEIVATGGFLTHYNPPYADLFMEVSPAWRRKGLGSYLVQELRRVCRDSGLVPAARCRAENPASRRTLERAGMSPCGRIVRGLVGQSFGFRPASADTTGGLM